MCVCVCVCVCMYIYIYMCVCVCVCILHEETCKHEKFYFLGRQFVSKLGK